MGTKFSTKMIFYICLFSLFCFVHSTNPLICVGKKETSDNVLYWSIDPTTGKTVEVADLDVKNYGIVNVKSNLVSTVKSQAALIVQDGDAKAQFRLFLFQQPKSLPNNAQVNTYPLVGGDKVFQGAVRVTIGFSKQRKSIFMAASRLLLNPVGFQTNVYEVVKTPAKRSFTVNTIASLPVNYTLVADTQVNVDKNGKIATMISQNYVGENFLTQIDVKTGKVSFGTKLVSDFATPAVDVANEKMYFSTFHLSGRTVSSLEINGNLTAQPTLLADVSNWIPSINNLATYDNNVYRYVSVNTKNASAVTMNLISFNTQTGQLISTTKFGGGPGLLNLSPRCFKITSIEE